MVDKEINSHAVDSPNSPSHYSDEAYVRESSVAGAAPTVASPAMSHDRFLTDSNRHSASLAIASASSPPAPAAPQSRDSLTGRHTPVGLSSSVAALVEEGMTEEEIRRLEEEERALDRAIEEAGRR